MARGGKREGAGRKLTDSTPIAYRISTADKAFIDGLAAEMGVTQGRIIHELIEAFKQRSEEPEQ